MTLRQIALLLSLASSGCAGAYSALDVSARTALTAIRDFEIYDASHKRAILDATHDRCVKDATPAACYRSALGPYIHARSRVVDAVDMLAPALIAVKDVGEAANNDRALTAALVADLTRAMLQFTAAFASLRGGVL